MHGGYQSKAVELADRLPMSESSNSKRSDRATQQTGPLKWRLSNAFLAGALCLFASARLSVRVPPANQVAPYELNDVHFHLTNYIQKGAEIHDFLAIMGSKVGRVALFGIPLQQ